MYGVVLWSDRRLKTAVIWCEDHGDLALLAPEDDGLVEADIAHGDVIAFELDPESAFRRARNARIVDSQAYPLLARSLTDRMETQQSCMNEREPSGSAAPELSNVISFATRSGAQA
ncbi:MAG: hypothetical protein ACQEVT_06540 [Pseudomonadota bacterium]|uniref:hypothetical protein n=1 Tax=Roseovarius TaxID=74030 RepID=UPI0022A6DD08|nr:hypothetical protein [Roseovarius sp. EGI FJ00037]MCZ0810854.1 hypothetical protein [Roseovarius sp. EGI FJ00037]